MQFTSDLKLMDKFVNAGWLIATAWFISGVIITLNLKLLYDFFFAT